MSSMLTHIFLTQSQVIFFIGKVSSTTPVQGYIFMGQRYSKLQLTGILLVVGGVAKAAWPSGTGGGVLGEVKFRTSMLLYHLTELKLFNPVIDSAPCSMDYVTHHRTSIQADRLLFITPFNVSS